MKKSLNLANSLFQKREFVFSPSGLVRDLLLGTIKIYQKTISPDHGILSYRFPFGVCKYSPTCSEYAYQSIKQYGVIKGVLLAIKRVLRCNPFAHGGYDPVPNFKKY